MLAAAVATRMVVCGSEDGSLFVWEEESGAVLLDSWAVGLNGPLLQVAWCPHDHVLACCSYGPVRMLKARTAAALA